MFEKYRAKKRLKNKSHYIKGLGIYIFLSWDFFDIADKKCVDIDLIKMNESKKHAVAESIKIIYAAALSFSHTAMQFGLKTQRHVPLQQIEFWAKTYPEEYAAAVEFITLHFAPLKKKEVEQVEASK